MKEIGGEEEIRPVSSLEEKKIFDKFSQLALATQIGFNSLQRQAMHNLATAALHPDKKFSVNIPSLTSGLSARILSQGMVTYPCLQVRKYLAENTDQTKFAITLKTSLVDTIIGVPLEVYGSLKTLKTLGIDISKKDLLMISAKSFTPFFLRNSISWAAINDDSQDNLFVKACKAAFSGIASTMPHNIGMKVVEYSSGRSVVEVAKLVVQDIKFDPSILTKGAVFRTGATVGSVFCLSPKLTKALEDSWHKVFSAENPSSSIGGISSQKLVDSGKSRQQ